MIKFYTYFTKSKNTDTKTSNTFVVLGLRTVKKSQYTVLERFGTLYERYKTLK